MVNRYLNCTLDTSTDFLLAILLSEEEEEEGWGSAVAEVCIMVSESLGPLRGWRQKIVDTTATSMYTDDTHSTAQHTSCRPSGVYTSIIFAFLATSLDCTQINFGEVTLYKVKKSSGDIANLLHIWLVKLGGSFLKLPSQTPLVALPEMLYTRYKTVAQL